VRVVTTTAVEEIEPCVFLRDDHRINKKAIALNHKKFPKKEVIRSRKGGVSMEAYLA